MFIIKSIYFNLLAIQISLIKLIKKIYFATNYYNNSLISKTPQQFYFHPNPFLLANITNYKKFSFKIHEIDPNIFWIKQKNKREQEDRHNFLWLNLIDRKNDGKSIQKIINIWMLKYAKYKMSVWESSILSKRVISWILNVDIILNNELFEFKRKFLTSIISQANHLKKNIKFEKNYSKRVEILTALLLTGLVFKEYEENYEIAMRELEKLVKTFFDDDGFPLSRNPNDLVFFSKYFILCQQCIKDAQKYLPEFLELIIKKNLICIKKILTPNDQMPLFNGAIEEDLRNLFKHLENIEIDKKNTKNIVGGIQILKFKNNQIFFDVGEPPNKSFSKSYQSGPLSFELHIDGIKIITNCGFGNNISPKAKLLSRLTSAQSTLTLNDSSVTKFERSKLINKVFGNSIKNYFKISKHLFNENREKIEAEAMHNGYEKEFGCLYKRKILIEKSKNNLQGIDEIIRNTRNNAVNYSLRFHLYPGLTAVKTMGGNSVLIQLSKNKSLIFTIKGENILLEKSIFLGSNKILNNTCVTVSGNLINQNKVIQWEIKKNI